MPSYHFHNMPDMGHWHADECEAEHGHIRYWSRPNLGWADFPFRDHDGAFIKILTGSGSSAKPSNPDSLAPTGEIRSVDPDTGAEKGVKPERFDLVPPDALAELSRVFGFGATKYADRNWERGYSWGKSYAALMRHMTAWWGGEDVDPESGQSHVAHAMWHCSVLLTFIRTHPEKDDRP